jgi:hypothetical protein
VRGVLVNWILENWNLFGDWDLSYSIMDRNDKGLT